MPVTLFARIIYWYPKKMLVSMFEQDGNSASPSKISSLLKGIITKLVGVAIFSY